MKTQFSIVLLFPRDSPFVYECLANFRSISVHFLWFFAKTTINRKFLTQNFDFFCHFEHFSIFLVQNSVPGGGGGQLSIFGQFWSIFMSTT